MELSVAKYVCREIGSLGEAPCGRGGEPRITAAHDSGIGGGISYGWWSSPSSLRLSWACLGDGLPYSAQAGDRAALRSLQRQTANIISSENGGVSEWLTIRQSRH